jgi:hypothetical protein
MYDRDIVFTAKYVWLRYSFHSKICVIEIQFSQQNMCNKDTVFTANMCDGDTVFTANMCDRDIVFTAKYVW